jgi:hypothetical protein
MRKPNHYQQSVIERIERGDQTVTGPQDTRPRLTVKSFQYSRDGLGFVAHRTVLKPEDERTGNPRLDYRVEMWRIPAEGVAYRL